MDQEWSEGDGRIVKHLLGAGALEDEALPDEAGQSDTGRSHVKYQRISTNIKVRVTPMSKHTSK